MMRHSFCIALTMQVCFSVTLFVKRFLQPTILDAQCLIINCELLSVWDFVPKVLHLNPFICYVFAHFTEFCNIKCVVTVPHCSVTTSDSYSHLFVSSHIGEMFLLCKKYHM